MLLWLPDRYPYFCCFLKLEISECKFLGRERKKKRLRTYGGGRSILALGRKLRFDVKTKLKTRTEWIADFVRLDKSIRKKNSVFLADRSIRDQFNIRIKCTATKVQ